MGVVMVRRLIACLFGMTVLCTAVAAEPLRPVNKTATPVIDQTSSLSTSERAGLEQSLRQIESESGAQVVLAIVAAEKGERLFDFAQDTFRNLRIGSAAKDNGLLIVLSITDGNVRVHPGYGLEGDIPDAVALHIASTISTAYLAGGSGAAAHALEQGLVAVKSRLPADLKERPSRKKEDALLLLFVIAIIVTTIAHLLHPFIGGGVGALTFAGAGFGCGLAASGIIIAGFIGFVFGLIARHVFDFISFGGGGGGWSGGGGDAGGAGAEIIGGILGALGE